MAQTFYMSGVSLITQYLTNIGIIATGGQLNTYVGGSVNTPVTTFTDSTGVVSNPNPMTLVASGRPGTPAGGPTAFWVPAGTLVKLVVTDAGGNLLVQLDNIPSINDLTASNNSLQTLLASPASSNPSGSGPVAGVDLVANAVKSYDIIADVRAANTPVLANGQTLSMELQGGAAVGDNLGGFFYWAPTSPTADDGRTVIKPATAGLFGRWLRYYPLGIPQIIVAAADQSVVNNTALQADTALDFFGMLPGTYLFQVRMQMLGIGGTGQGWKVQANFTGTLVAGSNAGAGVSSGNLTAAATYAAINTTITNAAISSTTADVINLDFILQISVTGVLDMQFAQNSSSANATVRKAGSSITLTRLA